jgi:hypothetical protein
MLFAMPLLLPALLMSANLEAPPAASAPASAPAGSEKLCGWVVNPTPGNYWLVDRQTRWNTGWLISSQGGYQARGMDEMPDMTTRGQVKTNGNYGYSCGCLQARLDRRNRQVTRIYSAEPAPLAQCRRDRRLPQPPRRP